MKDLNLSYEKQAVKFMDKYGVTLEMKRLGRKQHFPSDKRNNTWRDVYAVTLAKTGRPEPMRFRFGASIHSTENGYMPTAYDILSCLTKYDVGSFEEFCSEFGYETNSRTAVRIYKAVKHEYAECLRLFGPESIKLWYDFCKIQ